MEEKEKVRRMGGLAFLFDSVLESQFCGSDTYFARSLRTVYDTKGLDSSSRDVIR
jgi:hypothetical protein